MSLRNKIVLILAAVALLYVGVDVAVLRTMIAQPFRSLEEQQVAKDNERVKAGIDALVGDIATLTRALGTRADTRAYLAGEDPAFEQRALGDDTIAEMGLNLLYLCDAEGDVVWGGVEDSATREPLSVREFPADRIHHKHPLHLVRRNGQPPAGMMNTERGPMLVALYPVHDSGGEYVGAVIAGRFFDDRLREDLLARTHVEADVLPAEERSPELSQAVWDEVTGNHRFEEGSEDRTKPVYDYRSDDRVDAYVRVEDVMGAATLVLRSTFDRTITASGKRILDYAFLSTLATALLLLLVLLRLLERIVLKPLSKLTRHAAEIGRTEDMSRRVALDRDDELGELSEEFDGLMGKLQRSREQVIETARVAGMSEIATGILHNVGNVLNSVNVSTNLATAKAERLAIRDLQAMTAVLSEHEGDLARFVTEDERGKQFLPFLGELASEMTSQRDELVGELRSLGNGVDHVIELVRNQQSYAGMSGVFEPTDLSEAVDAAMSICEQAYTLRGNIELVREYDPDMPRVAVDKHKLMEILVNLIQNAGQVMRDAETPNQRLVCRVGRDESGFAVIEVEDNGPGIAPENLARVFAHGFTTRREGHGFGLHVSANAATEMKGSLQAKSDGPGAGATFTLRLPLNPKEAAVAA